jgi:peptide/nickel transport system substrate-binding protein
VKVTTKVPWVDFPAFLWSSGRLGMIGQAQLDDTKTCDRKMIGTGPFMLKDWQVNDHLTAVRNPNWWYAKVSGKPYPYLNSITYRPIITGTDMERALLAGQIDLGHFSQERIISDLRQQQASKNLHLDTSVDNSEVGYIMFNSSKAPFNNDNARLALAYATDRDKINQLIYAGIGRKASGPFAPGALGYLPDTGYPEYNLTKAKAAVAAYKQATGQDLKFTITTSTDPITIDLVQALQNEWKQAGINVKINPISDQSQLINIAIGGQFEAVTWRNHPGSDPDTQYVWWNNGNPANPVNFGRFNDPVINKDLNDGRSEPNPVKRKAIYEDLNREFAKKLWNLWGTWVQWTIASQSKIHMVGGPQGPPFPSGAQEYRGLAVGHPVYQMWVEGGGGSGSGSSATTG